MERNQTWFLGERGEGSYHFQVPPKEKGKPGEYQDPMHCGWQNALCIWGLVHYL